MKHWIVAVSVMFAASLSFADYGVSAWGKLTYPKDFTHFDYVNPDAPVGGEFVIASLGSFSSLNMFIVLGEAAQGLSLAHATLLEPAFDCIQEEYAYLAKDVEISPDRRKVTFTLRDDATFTDGTKITSEDILFSFNVLREKGMPVFRTYYREVEKVEADGPLKVVFHIKESKIRELPVILGQIPALSKKFYAKHDFAKPSLIIPPVSGGYEITDVKPGESIIYKRRANWWGHNIPAQKGRMNFEKIRYVYYKDNNAMFEGFKSGEVHIRVENIAKLWATGYNFSAIKDGHVKKEEIHHKMSMGTYGLFFNTRKEIFKDIRVRKALCLLYDFEWANENLFYGQYKRNLSYFPNSELAAKGPITNSERAFLNRANITLSKDTEGGFSLPTFKNPNDKRRRMEEALALFKEAGWVLKGQKLVNESVPVLKKGLQFSFTVFAYDPTFERVYGNYIETLRALGVDVNIRQMDPSSYQEKIESLDFEVLTTVLPQSNSPGAELRDYFGSASVHSQGTKNYACIADPKIDALIEDIISSQSFEDLRSGMHALDRVLLDGYYMLPAWSSDSLHIAYWDKFAHPKISPKYNPLAVDTWWFREFEATKRGGTSTSSSASPASSALSETLPPTTGSFGQGVLTWMKSLFVKEKPKICVPPTPGSSQCALD